MSVAPWACWYESQKRMLDHWELELQVGAENWTRVLWKSGYCFNCWAISLLCMRIHVARHDIIVALVWNTWAHSAVIAVTPHSAKENLSSDLRQLCLINCRGFFSIHVFCSDRNNDLTAEKTVFSYDYCTDWSGSLSLQ